MFETYSIIDLPLAALIVLVVFSAVFGVAGYLIASRRGHRSFLVFLALFAFAFLFLVFLEAAVLSLWPSVHEGLCGFTADLAGSTLGAMGVVNSVSGSTITVENPTLAFSVDPACLGGMLFWAYIALVLAELRATNRQLLTGILIGLFLLLAFNFFRITLSIYLEWRTGVHVHDYFYVVNMVVVLVVWAGWQRTLGLRGAKAVLRAPQQESGSAE